jgi:hypothetical protein
MIAGQPGRGRHAESFGSGCKVGLPGLGPALIHINDMEPTPPHALTMSRNDWMFSASVMWTLLVAGALIYMVFAF